MKKRILIVVGTRPNFIKITQFPGVLKGYYNFFEYKIVHTGQHFDDKMSTVFFKQFGLAPDIYLNIGQGTATAQMANIMLGLEKCILDYSPDLVIVVGDVNSTLAAAITANKMNVKIAHLESGLRSFDRSMPEEINRIVTDDISDHFFITEQSGMDHLLNEGKDASKLHFVGNTMIDTLVSFQDEIENSDVLQKFNISEDEYILMTMHRPATVDNKFGLEKLFDLIELVTKKYKLVFPIHPRTLARIESMGFNSRLKSANIILTEPLDYFAFQKLIKKSKFILTDSGGIQEESTYYQVPCFTLRPNTERPSTVTIGSNELVPFDLEIIKAKIAAVEAGKHKKGGIPLFWDGKATERIGAILNKILL